MRQQTLGCLPPTRGDHPDAPGRHFIPSRQHGNKLAPLCVWHGRRTRPRDLASQGVISSWDASSFLSQKHDHHVPTLRRGRRRPARLSQLHGLGGRGHGVGRGVGRAQVGAVAATWPDGRQAAGGRRLRLRADQRQSHRLLERRRTKMSSRRCRRPSVASRRSRSRRTSSFTPATSRISRSPRNSTRSSRC